MPSFFLWPDHSGGLSWRKQSTIENARAYMERYGYPIPSRGEKRHLKASKRPKPLPTACDIVTVYLDFQRLHEEASLAGSNSRVSDCGLAVGRQSFGGGLPYVYGYHDDAQIY